MRKVGRSRGSWFALIILMLAGVSGSGFIAAAQDDVPPIRTPIQSVRPASPIPTISRADELAGSEVNINPDLTLVLVYEQPGEGSPVVEALSGAIVVILTGQSQIVSEITWWEIESPSGSLGWVTEAQDETPTLILANGDFLASGEGQPSSAAARTLVPTAARTEAVASVSEQIIIVSVALLLVYEAPDTDGAIVEALGEGVPLTVLNPAQIVGRDSWWRVRTPSGTEGYILELTDDVPSFITQANAQGELSIGVEAVVILPDQVLMIHEQPDAESSVVEAAVNGVTLTIIGGPELVGDVEWWQVRSISSVEGWAAEQVDNQVALVHPNRVPTPTPTLVPTQIPTTLPTSTATAAPCPGAPPSILSVGIRAYVVLGTPNRLRASAGTSTRQIGQIRGGEEFTIVGGPICTDGYRWWQVEFQGEPGWTADGEGDEYWVRPVQ